MAFIAGNSRRDNYAPLPLFHAVEMARIRSMPLAVRRLARRHAMPAATALLVAEAAGLECGR